MPVHRLSFRTLVVGTRARAHRTRKGVRGSTPLPRQISSCCMALRRVTKSQLRASFTHFALDEKRTNQIVVDSDDQVIIYLLTYYYLLTPDDGLPYNWRLAFETGSPPSVPRLGRASAGARRRQATSAAAAWPHGSLGAHHAATRFYGAAHRLVVEL